MQRSICRRCHHPRPIVQGGYCAGCAEALRALERPTQRTEPAPPPSEPLSEKEPSTLRPHEQLPQEDAARALSTGVVDPELVAGVGTAHFAHAAAQPPMHGSALSTNVFAPPFFGPIGADPVDGAPAALAGAHELNVAGPLGQVVGPIVGPTGPTGPSAPARPANLPDGIPWPGPALPKEDP